MDFSLVQPNARHRFLRDILAIKRRWMYYAILIIDPILRFSWVFYAAFTHDRQHNTIVSFLVALAEVSRRGMWAVFRVENEHCSNVAQYKASRDVPLPYDLGQESLSESERVSLTNGGPQQLGTGERSSMTAGADQDPMPSSVGARKPTTDDAAARSPEDETEGGGLRRRKRSRTIGGSISRLIAEAHRQDFVKKRPPPVPSVGPDVERGDNDILASDEDDEDADDGEESDTGSVLAEREEIRNAKGLAARGNSDEDQSRRF